MPTAPRIDPRLQDQRRAGPDEWRRGAPGSARCASIIDPPCAAPSVAEPTAVRRRRAMRGITLIELMIAVALIGILAGVAVPGFESQLRKVRRADALVAILQMQAAQERFRSNGASYGTLAAIGAPSVSPAGHYTLHAAAAGAEGYELTASATGTQARDTACRHLKLSVVGANLVFASGADAAVANPHGTNRRCWNL